MLLKRHRSVKEAEQKLFWFLRSLIFCPDFFDQVGERLDKKAKVNLKIYGLTTWIISNYNTHICQYLKN